MYRNDHQLPFLRQAIENNKTATTKLIGFLLLNVYHLHYTIKIRIYISLLTVTKIHLSR